MPIQLSKGQGINLSKDHGLTRAILEVTYDLDPSHPVKKHEMDVGIMAFEVSHASGKPQCPQDECFVFYNNKISATGGVVHEEDGGSKGDDKIDIDFAKVQAGNLQIDEISCVAEIYEGLKRGHSFGQFSHCTAHIINPDNGEVIAEFKLTDEDSDATAVQLGSFVFADGHVHFKAVGVGYKKGLEDFLTVYGLQAADEE